MKPRSLLASDDRLRSKRRAVRESIERIEDRVLLSTADGNGPVVTGLSAPTSPSALLLTFDGPLLADPANNVANYRVNRVGTGNHQFVTTNGPGDPVVSVIYNDTTHQVTLGLARPLAAGVTYRVFINGTPGTGELRGANGVLFDGDNDDTPGGDFYGLFARGKSLGFNDLAGDIARVGVVGGGEVQLWRELDGDVDQLTVIGAVQGQSALTGSVRPAKGSSGLVVIPSLQGMTGVTNDLPPSFVSQAPTPPALPMPVVATSQNLPYSLQITPVAMPSLPSIQSAVFAQSNGLWLMFGGRTNGLHGFSPGGTVNFPPTFQNPNIVVVNPTTGQTWTEPWSATGLPSSVTASLSSSNQEFYQKGDRLYTAGGYSFDANSGVFTTYDTFTSVSVSGLINAVVQNGDVAAQVRQISDPRFRVTGGEMLTIGNRTYLVFGQDFEGGYNGSTADFVQIYSDEVRSFRIVDHATALGITNYRAQRDPVNFRRRDYNLGPSVAGRGGNALTAFGGVFTPAGNGYRFPIVIGPDGIARVDTRYQQFFSQYTTANFALYDAKARATDTVFLGGISLYHYNFATGALTQDSGLPFVNDVTTFARNITGATQEYIMPSQLPARLGTDAAFFQARGLPTNSNGVVQLNRLKGPTTIGYMVGGIYSTVDNTTDPATQTTASNLVFKVTVVPN
jgi:hypothetical protein